MIYDITHTQDAKPIETVMVRHRLAIGRPGEKNPTKLDHFEIRSIGQDGKWITNERASADLAKAYGVAAAELRAVRVYLCSDDPEAAFETEYALKAGRAARVVCHGNGLVALRRENLEIGGRPREHSPCGAECDELIAGACRPNCRLFFELADGPLAGTRMMWWTVGYHSLKAVNGSIHAIHRATGGFLRGIPLWLTVGPKKTSYAKGAKTTTIQVVGLDYRPIDASRTIAEMLEFSAEYRGVPAPAVAAPEDDQALDDLAGEFPAPADEWEMPQAVDDGEPEPEEPDPPPPTAPKYTWDDVPEKEKRVVAWYLQQAMGREGKDAITEALAKATLPMETIVAKAKAKFAEEEG